MQTGQRTILTKLAARTILAMALTLPAVNMPAQEGRKAISNPAPAYPETARSLHIRGAVKVQILIAPDGHIKDIKVIGGHPLFVDSVQETLKTWKYAPASTESTAVLEFNFHP
jgi:TonB family protein